MKACFAVLLSILSFTVSVDGQIPPAREIMKKSIPKDQQRPVSPPPSSAAKPAQTPAVKSVAPVIREKTEKEKAEIEKKTIEFQMQRAKEGSASSQYDLGMRFLTGNGVDKNEETARKWLGDAAKQGHTAAVKKIQELDKKK